jgi:hypothetical protein
LITVVDVEKERNKKRQEADERKKMRSLNEEEWELDGDL